MLAIVTFDFVTCASFLEFSPNDNDDDDSDVGDGDVHPGEHDMHAGMPPLRAARAPVHSGFDQQLSIVQQQQ